MSDEESGYLSPSMVNDVRNAIANSMAENGTEEKPGALQSLPTPAVDDVSLKYANLLNDETREALSLRVTSTIDVKDDGSLSQIRYLGKKTKLDSVDDAAKVVTEKLNELAASGFIEGALLPLSTLKFTDDHVAVISYVMLTAEGVEFFDENFNDVRVDEAGQVSEL